LLETSVCWLSRDVVSLEIEVGVNEKFAKGDIDVFALQAASIAAANYMYRIDFFTGYYYYYNHLTTPWTVSRTTRVSR